MPGNASQSSIGIIAGAVKNLLASLLSAYLISCQGISSWHVKDLLSNLAEVESVDGEAYNQRKGAGASQQGGNKKLPVVPSPLFPNPQKPHRLETSLNMVKLELDYVGFSFLRFILS